jgi:hypothetical protein
MGGAKDWQIEQDERGWKSVPGKYVCAECFEDDFLRKFVSDQVERSICDYCGSTGEELTGEAESLIAAPFNSVMRIIAEGIRSEWNSADDEGIIYETAEGGYQASTYDSYDLVWEHVCPANDNLAQQIIDALPDQTWVKRNYYSLSKNEALLFGWRNFCEFVKYENRFMFQLRQRRTQSGDRATASTAASAESFDGATIGPPAGSEIRISKVTRLTDEHESAVGEVGEVGVVADLISEHFDSVDFNEAIAEAEEGISASDMLDAIGESVREVDLVKKLPALTKFIRARVGPANRYYRTARTLGPPPRRRAIANRMSPEGIPMFYGASDEYTATAEIVPGRLKRGRILNVGSFETLEEFLVLDLTALPPIPSLFSDLRYLRPTLSFLYSFVRDLSKPMKKDGREHIDYVPTQILTEYFRHSFLHYDGEPVRGILYPSSRVPHGTACVLFFTREECGAMRAQDHTEPKKQWLRFIKPSHEIFKHKPRRPRHWRPAPFRPDAQLLLEL